MLAPTKEQTKGESKGWVMLTGTNVQFKCYWPLKVKQNVDKKIEKVVFSKKCKRWLCWAKKASRSVRLDILYMFGVAKKGLVIERLFEWKAKEINIQKCKVRAKLRHFES